MHTQTNVMIVRNYHHKFELHFVIIMKNNKHILRNVVNDDVTRAISDFYSDWFLFSFWLWFIKFGKGDCGKVTSQNLNVYTPMAEQSTN